MVVALNLFVILLMRLLRLTLKRLQMLLVLLNLNNNSWILTQDSQRWHCHLWVGQNIIFNRTKRDSVGD